MDKDVLQEMSMTIDSRCFAGESSQDEECCALEVFQRF